MSPNIQAHVRSGRVIVVACAAALALLELTEPLIAPGIDTVNVPRLVLTLLLCVPLVLGRRWARWVTVFLLSLGVLNGLLTLAILGSPTVGNLAAGIFILAVDLAIVLLLLFSGPVATYFAR